MSCRLNFMSMEYAIKNCGFRRALLASGEPFKFLSHMKIKIMLYSLEVAINYECLTFLSSRVSDNGSYSLDPTDNILSLSETDGVCFHIIVANKNYLYDTLWQVLMNANSSTINCGRVGAILDFRGY